MADSNQNSKKKAEKAEKDDSFEAPVLTREPTAKQVNLGGPLTLRVTAAGKPLPSYQWYLNGKKISGANSDRYRVNRSRREHGGNYTCEVKNYLGRVMSRPAMISFIVERLPPLVIEPALAEIPAGNPFAFTVTGAPPEKLKKLSLQWTFNGKRINGARGTELTFTEVKKKYEGEYKVLIFIGGEMRATNKVTLKITPANSVARVLSAAEAVSAIPAAKPPVMDDFFFNPEDEQTGEVSAATTPAPEKFLSPFSDLSSMPSATNRKLAKKKKKLEAMLSAWQRRRGHDQAA